jgi:hypothetical protein
MPVEALMTENALSIEVRPLEIKATASGDLAVTAMAGMIIAFIAVWLFKKKIVRQKRRFAASASTRDDDRCTLQSGPLP